MARTGRYFPLILCVGILSVASTRAWGVPYASGVRNTSGSTWEFVLNEPADSVTVLRDGANPYNPGTTAGRLTFDMAGFSTFEIQVSKSAAPGWTPISDIFNPYTNYSVPSGVAINTDPSSLDYFGTVYVSSAFPETTPVTTEGYGGRMVGDGVYALTADLVGVELDNNFAAVADANDTSQAKAPGWTVSGSDSSSPWRLSLDEAGNLIVSDWSDASGGIKYATRDLTSGGLVLSTEDGISPLLLDPSTNTHEMHGSIASKTYTTGSVGNNLVVYAMDEDYDLDGDTLINAESGNNVWKWNVGSETDYEGAPELVIATGAISTFLDLNIGVRAGAHYDPQHDKWYLTQYRFDGDQTGLVVVDADGPGADLADPNAPNVLFDSLPFSMDNNLDGNTGAEEIQDIFRLAGDVTLSPDGTKLILHRIGAFGANPVLDPGAVVIIPLDANGVPDIQIDDNGTPGDPSDDTLANVETITITNNDGAHTLGTSVKFDAAGNLYTTNSASDLLEVFSPGGDWIAVTKSDGTFELIPGGGEITGDYDDSSQVAQGDLDLVLLNWGKTVPPDPVPDGWVNQQPSGLIGQGALDGVLLNWGNTAGSGANNSVAVPEPAAFVTILIAAAALGARRRTRRIRL